MTLTSKLSLTALVLSGILLLILTTVLLLHTEPARRFTLDRVEDVLRRQGIDLEAERLDYNLWQLSTTLTNVTIRSEATPDLPPFARIRSVSAEISLRALLDGVIRVRNVRVQEPDIHLVIDERGRNNIPRPPEREEPRDFLIESLVASQGSLRIVDRRQPLIVSLPQWQTVVAGDPATLAHEIRFQTQQRGQATLEGRPLAIERVAADVRMARNVTEIRSVTVNADNLRIDVAGQIRNGVVNLTADADLRLGPLLRFAGVTQDVQGDFTVRADIRGPTDHPRILATMHGRNIRVEGLAGIDLRAETAYIVGAQRVELTRFRMQSPAGAAEGRADIALTAQAGRSFVQANIDRLDVGQVSRILESPIQIASRATGTVNAWFQGLAFRQAEADITLRLTPTIERPAEDVLPVGGQLSAVLRPGRLAMNLRPIEALGTRAEGQVRFALPGWAMDGDVRVAIPSIDTTLSKTADFVGRETLLPFDVDGPARAEARLEGTLTSPLITATLFTEDAEIGDLRPVTIDAGVVVDPAQVAIRESTVRWADQALVAEGTIGIRAPQPLAISARLVEASVPAILAAAGRPDIPAEGLVTAEAEIGGTLGAPEMEFTAVGWDLAAYGEPLGAFEAQASLRNQLFELSRFRLDKPPPGLEGGTLDAYGTYNLATGVYTIAAEGTNLRIEQLVLPGDVPVRGVLNLAAQGEGTVDDPVLRGGLSVADLRVRGEEVGQAAAQFYVADREALLGAEVPLYNLTSTARIGVEAPFPARFHVRFDQTDIERLPVEFPRPVTGTITARVDGNAELARPEDARIAAVIPELAIVVDQMPIRAEEPILLRYANRTLFVDQAEITADDSRLEVAGSLPLDTTAPPGRIAIRGDINMQTIVIIIPVGQPLTGRGRVELAAELRGYLTAIEPEATIRLADGFINSPDFNPIVDLEVAAFLRDGLFVLERASWFYAAGTFEATGRVPLAILPWNLPLVAPPRPETAQLSLVIDRLDLGATGELPDPIGGVISLRLDAQAPEHRLEALRARAVFDRLELEIDDLLIEQREPVTLAAANGIARIEQLNLVGPQTLIQASGTVGLADPYPLALRLGGDLDASILALFADNVRARGETRVEVVAGGTWRGPQVTGFAQVANADITITPPGLAFEHMNARFDLDRDRVTITQLESDLNGGRFRAGGTFRLGPQGPENIFVDAQAEDVFLNYPVGFRTLSEAAISVRSKDALILIGGDVRVLEGLYTEPILVETQLLRALRGGDAIDLTIERRPFLERIRYNVNIQTVDPVVIDNNIARLAIEADLRVVGTYYRPSVVGNLTLEEGGDIFLNERRYIVERGVVNFVSEQRIQPSLDIVGSTRAGGYDVTIRVTGEPGDIRTILSSDPPLPEPDIIAVLLTGRTLEEVRAAEVTVAQEQALSLLAGNLGLLLAQQTQAAFGFTRVRIDPLLISPEVSPAARLTVSQDLTRDLNLLYSMNLADSADQIWILAYNVTRRFLTRVMRQQDGTTRFEFRHDMRFGGTPRPLPRHPVRPRNIGEVRIFGDPFFPESEIERRLGLRPGARYEFFRVRRRMDRLEDFYAERDYLETRIRLRRIEQNDIVDLDFTVMAGPRVQFVYEGWIVSPSLRERIREIWRTGVFDMQRAEDAALAIRENLVREGHVLGTVEYVITTPAPNLKRVLFEIRPGPWFREFPIVFEGARAIPPEALERVLQDAQRRVEVFTRPREVVNFLRRYYREHGYLDAEIELPRYAPDPGARTGRAVIVIAEGRQSRVGRLEFLGNAAFTDAQLLAAIPLKEGAPFLPEQRELSFTQLQDMYLAQGYDQVEITYQTERRRQEMLVDLVFFITENRQAVVQEAEIAGNEITSDRFVRGELPMTQGQALTPDVLSLTRRNLYRTGAFTTVDVETRTVPDRIGLMPFQRPVRTIVSVREVQPYQLRYGGFFDTERGPGLISDTVTYNTLGGGRALGLRLRYDSQFQDARLYFQQPVTRALPVLTNAVVSATRLRIDDVLTETLGLTLDQETRFRRHYLVTYGYRLQNTRTRDIVTPDPLIDMTIRTAPLIGTFTRDTRDSLLDATHGSFFSNAVELAGTVTGSQLNFGTYFGQYFRYHPLGLVRPVPFGRGLEQPRLILAGTVRAGVGGGFAGQILPFAQRFFAGGSTSVRGFRQNTLGPLGPDGQPLGGDAVFISNLELRFPIWSIFDGVTFFDAGNVFLRAQDFNPLNSRTTVGAGLRLRLPFFLIRFDYGHKLDRRPGETAGRFYISIGQAF